MYAAVSAGLQSFAFGTLGVNFAFYESQKGPKRVNEGQNQDEPAEELLKKVRF